jgi:hypothetical protein
MEDENIINGDVDQSLSAFEVFASVLHVTLAVEDSRPDRWH